MQGTSFTFLYVNTLKRLDFSCFYSIMIIDKKNWKKTYFYGVSMLDIRWCAGGLRAYLN